MFKLHPQLENDLIKIEDLNLSSLFLMESSENPWVVLVPRVEGVKEIIDLKKSDRLILYEEIEEISFRLKKLFNPDKLNIAALGNIVPQLHIHIQCRYIKDSNWPNSLFGTKRNIDQLVTEQTIKALKNKN